MDRDEWRKSTAMEDAFELYYQLARHTRATSLQMTESVEKALDYEKGIQRIALSEAEDNKVPSGDLTPKEGATKNHVQLQELADRMGRKFAQRLPIEPATEERNDEAINN
jgi:hypothetical protein